MVRTRNKLFSDRIAESGWTQDEVAQRVNLAYEQVTGRMGLWEGDYVGRLERGAVRCPQLPYRLALCRVFDVESVTELGMLERQRPRRNNQCDNQNEDDVRRIDFLRGVAAAGGGLMAGGLTASLEDAIAHIPAPRLVGMDHVAEVSRLTDVVRHADQVGDLPGWEVMASYMRRAVTLLEAAPEGKVNLNLNIATAALADAVGWAHFDAGHHAAADRFFKIGVHCATTAGAWWLRADVLSDMARQAIYLGRNDDALTLLGMAKVREDRISGLRRANLSAVQSRAFGALGDVRETLRSVRDADEYFHDAANDRDEPDYDSYANYFSYAQLNGDTGHGLFGIATRGHEVTETRHRLRVAAENYGDGWKRSRAFCQALDAVLALDAGEAENGAVLGLAVVEAARDIESARLGADMRLIHEATLGIDHPQVQVLRNQTAALIAL